MIEDDRLGNLHTAVARVLSFDKNVRTNATDLEMQTICSLLRDRELMGVDRITEKYCKEVLSRLPQDKLLRISAGRLKPILQHVQDFQKALYSSDMLSPMFLSAALNPEGMKAEALRNLEIEIPDKFIKRAAEIREQLKQRPVVQRGIL